MSGELSYFVNNEISRVIQEENFPVMSQDIFSKISEQISQVDSDPFCIYDEGTSLDQFFENEVEEENFIPFENLNNEPSIFPVREEIPEVVVSPPEELKNIEIPSTKMEVKHEENIEKPAIDSWMISAKESQKNNKNKCNRSIVPAEFLSLKRKDVVMKSIFRMMRRHYCKLLEDVTGYNRKEKCLHIKHKELLKNIVQGISKLNFSSFSNNMAFYFGAFAYPSDMRKILEESKQQYRTQNEVLSQALYIVQLVDNCFNRYSKKVLNDMLSIPQFSFLISYFLSNVDDLSSYPKPFQNCSKILLKARENVDNFNRS